jgi:tetratricopeptide (TPR) repeat protein
VAASALSKVMSELGDYRQALALNAEVIEWNAAHDETLTLSVVALPARHHPHETHEYDAALLAFANARALSVVGDEQGIAFADMRVCDVLIDLGDYQAARTRCEDALKIFAASGTIDVVKQTRSFLAPDRPCRGAPPGAGRAQRHTCQRRCRHAAARSDAAVQAAIRRQPRRSAIRSRPYADLNEYMRRYAATNETRRIRQVAALHARFEIDREIDRNASLQRELGQSKLRRERAAATHAAGHHGRLARGRVAHRQCSSARACIAGSSRRSPTSMRSRVCRTGATRRSRRGCARRFQAPRRATDHRADRPRSLQDDQ